MEVPKKIHALWLNFRSKTDGITKNLDIFIRRIKDLHPSWEIKLWTSWQEIQDELNTPDRQFMLNYINNEFCDQANKSDCLRFHILEKYGGVWLDLSTYLIEPLDELYEKCIHSFTTLYMPSHDAFMWVIKHFSDTYEELRLDDKINYAYNFLDLFIVSKHKFVCESYFIMSPAHHPILKEILQLMSDMWNGTILEKITSKKTHCNYLNLVMKELLPQVFKIDGLAKKILDFETEKYDCGYLWIYLLMTISTNNYIKDNKLSLNISPLSKGQKELISKSPAAGICHKDFCHDLNYSKNGRLMVHLISTSWWRIVKWSDQRDSRLNWEYTFLGDLINLAFEKKMSKDILLKILKENNITQLKTGAYTRGPTAPMIEKINYILNPSEDYHTVDKKVRGLRDDYLESRKSYKPFLKVQKKEANQMIKNFIDERTFVNTIGPGHISRKFSVTRKVKPRTASRTRSLRPASRFHKSNSFQSPLRKARKQRSRTVTRKTSPLGTNKTD